MHTLVLHPQKTTKAQKRREKQAAKQAERDARIAAELEAAGPSERQEEEVALKALLAPLGLGIKEIRVSLLLLLELYCLVVCVTVQAVWW
jgi:uncharacterized membrane protein